MVCGSSNTDMVVRTTHFPTPGETILGGAFLMNAGGKGANQAVAAARLGVMSFSPGKRGMTSSDSRRPTSSGRRESM